MNSDTLREQVEAWLKILDHSTYYEILGLLEIADESAIQNAFHQFSENFHPDRHRGHPAEIRAGVTRVYRRGAEAYGVLRDPKKRAAYDVAMSQGHLRWNPGHSSPKSADDLVSLCKTKAGAFHARQAERAISEKNWEMSRSLLRKALLAEDTNSELEERADELLRLAQAGISFKT